MLPQHQPGLAEHFHFLAEILVVGYNALGCLGPNLDPVFYLIRIFVIQHVSYRTCSVYVINCKLVSAQKFPSIIQSGLEFVEPKLAVDFIMGFCLLDHFILVLVEWILICVIQTS